MTATHSQTPTRRPRLRRPPIAHLLAALIGIYGLINAVRALVDPVGFAAAFGIPLSDPSETTFITIYASRTAALALAVLILVALQERRALAVLTSAAVLLPVADAVQTATAGAGGGTVLRHGLIALVLIVVALLCVREARTGTPPSPS